MKRTLQEKATPARTVGDSFAIVSDPGSRQPTHAMTHSEAERKAARTRVGSVHFIICFFNSSILPHAWSLTQEVADVHKKLLSELRIVAVEEAAHPAIAIHHHKAR
jgi:hypothetical protein